MALDRTTTTIRLKSDDGLYYSVSLVSPGGDIVVPEADNQSGALGTSDPYAAIKGSDGNIYRWSLETITSGPLVFVESLVQLSPNQSEPSLPGVDLLFGSEWLRVKVELQYDAFGNLIPNLIVVEGQPWMPPIKKGGLAIFTAVDRRTASYQSFATEAKVERTKHLAAAYRGETHVATSRRPSRTFAKY